MVFDKLSYINAKRIEGFPEYLKINDLGAKSEYEYYGSLSVDGIPEALLVVSDAQSAEGICVLEYIYVEESLRGCGFSEHLIAKLCELLRSRNISYLYYADFFESEDAARMINLMTRIGLTPLEDTGFIFKYKISDIVMDIMYDELLELSYSKNEIQQINDYSDLKIKKLIQTGEFYFSKADFEPNLSNFYLQKDGIHGAIVGKLYDDQVLNITATYADSYLREHKLFVYMFARLIDTLRTSSNMDYDIWIKINDFELAEDMTKTFASPYEMLDICEFVKAI